MDRPLPVAPGSHEVLCRQGTTGPSLRRTVLVRRGETTQVSHRAAITLALTRGDAVRVAGGVHQKSLSLPPNRYRVDVLKAGRVIIGGWVTIPLAGCRLVDQPTLSCE